ncbi:MAG: hypothetical protein DRO88_11380 [Promethearchaeia archaeon]|nr:MAG: hypothetical protein DRO88_11380 [Candidatus Lokiarchaeia archaeon]
MLESENVGMLTFLNKCDYISFMLEKVQKFLKNLHKFDHQPDLYDITEKLTSMHGKLKLALENDTKPEIENILGDYLIEFMEIANRYEINLSELLKNHYNLN